MSSMAKCTIKNSARPVSKSLQVVMTDVFVDILTNEVSPILDYIDTPICYLSTPENKIDKQHFSRKDRQVTY